MQRRKFVVGLGSLAAGGAAAMGTGAFSKMNSGDRTVAVRVADDANSFIALKPASKSNVSSNEHGQFVEYKEGKLWIQIDGSNTQRAKGVNPDSTYSFDNVFEIANEDADGNQQHVWISSNTADRVDFYWQGDPSDSAEGPNNSWQLRSGTSLGVGMSVDASGLAPDQYIEGNVVISAENTNN